MKQYLKISAAILGITTITALMALTEKKEAKRKVAPQPKIQVAILLDVSGSMDGLIDQAKTQLWNMVSTMGKAKCSNDTAPQIEIALYEYGRTTNDVNKGYVKLINGFMGDLDSLSQNLFSLKTNGGDEFCGQAIYTSINELKWDAEVENYKVIFIAGNEDFLQGNIQYAKACAAAKEKGVIVNTIYCGDKMQGIREHWNLAGECGNGSYTNINQNAREQEIPTPYDSVLYALNSKLNGTYIGYGSQASYFTANQSKVDAMNYSVSKSAGLKRISVKGKKGLYKNANWDLVDAVKDRTVQLENIDKKILPDSLKTKTKEELKAIINQKDVERNAIQAEIATNSVSREKFIAAEKAKIANKSTEATLETEVEKIIKIQAARFKMNIE
jgi:von Willebrand factor type A domain